MRSVRYIEDLYRTALNYPSPVNLSYLWNFGVYAMLCLGIQIITGITLAMHYTPEISVAFFSVEHLMREVDYGYILRYIHANGASFFFIVVYVHTFRGLYYGSFLYPRELLWIVGVVILLAMIITAFLGYVLPWGQMSFWGATVITNLLSAIPQIGQFIVEWLWGGFAINNATLNRFYSFHYVLPFIITGLVILHVIFLHQHGSNNPIGISFSENKQFNPYIIIKDLYGIFIFLIIFCYFVFFVPNLLGHPDNYIIASPLVTPAHIVPEWYFLPFYAILRSIPNKLGGVIFLLLSILSLISIVWLWKPEVRSLMFRPFSRYLFFLFVLLCLLLGWIGGKPVAEPYLTVGILCTFLYFFYFWILMPSLIWFEKYIWDLLVVKHMGEEKVKRKSRFLKIKNFVKSVLKVIGVNIN